MIDNHLKPHNIRNLSLSSKSLLDTPQSMLDVLERAGPEHNNRGPFQ